MTPSDIYWIMQADTIIHCALVITTVTGVAGAFSIMVGFCENSKLALVLAAFLLPISLGCGVTAGFYPNTKTQAAMHVLPAILNNEDLQEDASVIYELGVAKLKESLERVE